MSGIEKKIAIENRKGNGQMLEKVVIKLS